MGLISPCQAVPRNGKGPSSEQEPHSSCGNARWCRLTVQRSEQPFTGVTVLARASEFWAGLCKCSGK